MRRPRPGKLGLPAFASGDHQLSRRTFGGSARLSTRLVSAESRILRSSLGGCGGLLCLLRGTHGGLRGAIGLVGAQQRFIGRGLRSLHILDRGAAGHKQCSDEHQRRFPAQNFIHMTLLSALWANNAHEIAGAWFADNAAGKHDSPWQSCHLAPHRNQDKAALRCSLICGALTFPPLGTYQRSWAFSHVLLGEPSNNAV